MPYIWNYQIILKLKICFKYYPKTVSANKFLTINGSNCFFPSLLLPDKLDIANVSFENK